MALPLHTRHLFPCVWPGLARVVVKPVMSSSATEGARRPPPVLCAWAWLWAVGLSPVPPPGPPRTCSPLAPDLLATGPEFALWPVPFWLGARRLQHRHPAKSGENAQQTAGVPRQPPAPSPQPPGPTPPRGVGQTAGPLSPCPCLFRSGSRCCCRMGRAAPWPATPSLILPLKPRAAQCLRQEFRGTSPPLPRSPTDSWREPRLPQAPSPQTGGKPVGSG